MSVKWPLFSVCMFVYLSLSSITENVFMDFDEVYREDRNGPKTDNYLVRGDPYHHLDPEIFIHSFIYQIVYSYILDGPISNVKEKT